MNKKVNTISEYLLGLMGLAGILIITAGVFARFVLKVSIPWADETMRTMFVWAYFLGAAALDYESGLMRLNALEEILLRHGHKVPVKVLSIISEVCCVAFFGACAYYVGTTVQRYASKGITTSTSNTPAWVLPLAYGVGSVIICLVSVRNIVLAFRKENAKAEEMTVDTNI